MKLNKIMGRKKKIDFDFIPSEYQQKIFDFVTNGVGNASISASAGSGKSSTLVASIKLIPSKLKCIFLAFNKSVAEELSEKLKNYPNVHVRTSHSLGFLMLRRNVGNDIEIDEYKYRTYIKSNITELTTVQDLIQTRQQLNDYLTTILDLVNFARFNYCQSITEIDDVAKKYSIPIQYDECEVVLKVLKWGKENINIIDFTDMIWLPVELKMKPMGLQYDWIFVDESQDQSVISIELFKKCFKRGTRCIFVGDEYQCQPKGTKILMSDGTEKNIEDIKIGDAVVTYACNEAYFKNYKPKTNKNLSKVIDIEHHNEENIITIYAENGMKSSYTPSHICYAKINADKSKGKYILYLICNEQGMYRIGTSQFKKKDNGSFGVIGRIRSELCNKCWILDIFDTNAEARKMETILSYAYGIPQLIFSKKRSKSNKFITDEDVIDIYQELSKKYNMYDRAKQLLFNYNKDIKYPFYEYNSLKKISKNHISTYNACNLFPSIMDISYFDNTNRRIRTHGKNKRSFQHYHIAYSNIIRIEHHKGIFEVYSMNIEKEHNYIADGILTHNCIYTFAGSSDLAFNALKTMPNTQEFDLPISYRCDKNIIKLANKFVSKIKSRENADEGIVLENCSISDLKENDMVLARTKAPLIKLYTKLLKKGVSCYIKGQDIGSNLIKKLETYDDEDLNVDLKQDGVFAKLYQKLFKDRNKLMEKRGLDFDDATLSSSIMEEYDNINTLTVLAEKCKTKKELIEHIEDIFNKKENGICLSTIHKAKGLESDNVYILCHSTMPSKLAQQDWEKKQELNLIYVAYTRAKHKLGFISEREIPPCGSSQEPIDIINELMFIENKICKLFNTEPTVRMSNVDIAKFNLKNAVYIEEENNKLPQINTIKTIKDTNDLLNYLHNKLNSKYNIK